MIADKDLEANAKIARVDGFWRHCAFPLSPGEQLKANGRPMYALAMDMPGREAEDMLYYINAGCVVNAFNDYRGLALTPNCDLVTTWYENTSNGVAYSGGPTLRAQIETTRPITKGTPCYVNYGEQRLHNMQIQHGLEGANAIIVGDDNDVETLDEVSSAAETDDDDKDSGAEGRDAVARRARASEVKMQGDAVQAKGKTDKEGTGAPQRQANQTAAASPAVKTTAPGHASDSGTETDSRSSKPRKKIPKKSVSAKAAESNRKRRAAYARKKAEKPVNPKPPKDTATRKRKRSDKDDDDVVELPERRSSRQPKPTAAMTEAQRDHVDSDGDEQGAGGAGEVATGVAGEEEEAEEDDEFVFDGGAGEVATGVPREEEEAEEDDEEEEAEEEEEEDDEDEDEEGEEDDDGK
jgi:hypothetical protein